MTTASEPLRFPLPLKRYESFMLVDEPPQYPMTYVLELRLTGTLDRLAFETAVQQTLEVQPLLRARVERSAWRPSVWIPTDPPAVHWHRLGEASAAPGPIDIGREAGLRIWVEDHPTQPRVLLQFHHVATDGIGAMQFVGDVLARYGVLTATSGQTAPVPASVDVQRLHDREQLWPDRSFRARLWRTTVRRGWELSKCPPQPVVGNLPELSRQPTAPTGRFPSYHTQVIEGEACSRLRRAARGAFTLNDLAALAMFRALREWNWRQAPSREPGWLRLSLPFSLRLPMHDDSPAANQLSLLMLTQHESQLEDDRTVLNDIHRATEDSSQGCRGRLFTHWIGGVARNFPWLYRLGGDQGSFCSAILANIGEVRRHLRGRFPLDAGRIVAGSVRLDALLGAACVRRGARVATSIGTYAGKLFINLNVDPLALDESAGADLLQLFASQLLAVGGVGADADAQRQGPQHREAAA